MVCFYVFIGFWILFVFRSDLYCIEFFIPFEIEVEIVLKSLQRMLNAIVAIELTGVVLGAFDVFVDTDFYTETFFKSFHPPVSSISLHSSKEKPNFVSSWAICICNKQGMTRWTLEACLLTSTNNLYESMACIIAT